MLEREDGGVTEIVARSLLGHYVGIAALKGEREWSPDGATVTHPVKFERRPCGSGVEAKSDNDCSLAVAVPTDAGSIASVDVVDIGAGGEIGARHAVFAQSVCDEVAPRHLFANGIWSNDTTAAWSFW